MRSELKPCRLVSGANLSVSPGEAKASLTASEETIVARVRIIKSVRKVFIFIGNFDQYRAGFVLSTGNRREDASFQWSGYVTDGFTAVFVPGDSVKNSTTSILNKV